MNLINPSQSPPSMYWRMVVWYLDMKVAKLDPLKPPLSPELSKLMLTLPPLSAPLSPPETTCWDVEDEDEMDDASPPSETVSHWRVR